MLRDSFGKLTVEITREQLEAWVGHKLTDEQVIDLDDCIPDSSIPEAIETIVHEALEVSREGNHDDNDDCAKCQRGSEVNGHRGADR